MSGCEASPCLAPGKSGRGACAIAPVATRAADIAPINAAKRTLEFNFMDITGLLLLVSKHLGDPART
jgi:hypothetical protein